MPVSTFLFRGLWSKNCAQKNNILEGVTMYLAPEQLQALMQEVDEGTGNASVLCFDMLELKPNSPLPDLGWTTLLIDLYLKLCGEPWKLGIDSVRLEEFLTNSTTWMLASEGIQRVGPASYAAIQKINQPCRVSMSRLRLQVTMKSHAFINQPQENHN
jgi:hypothetical protein